MIASPANAVGDDAVTEDPGEQVGRAVDAVDLVVAVDRAEQDEEEIGSRNVKNASSRLRQNRRCSARKLVERRASRLVLRSATGRSPRASRRRTSSPSSSRPAASASRGQLVEHARRLVVRSDDSLAVPAVADLRPRAPPQLRGRPERDDRTVAEDGDAVGEPLGLLDVVRREQDRLAEVAQRSDRVPGRGARRGRSRSSARRGRAARGRRRGQHEVEPPLLPARQRFTSASRFSSSPTSATTSRGSRGARSSRRTVECSSTLRRVQRGRLEHDADPVAPAAAPSAGSTPSTDDLARVASSVALEDLDGRRLPGAVGAEQAEHLSFLDLERDPTEGVLPSVCLVRPETTTALMAKVYISGEMSTWS